MLRIPRDISGKELAKLRRKYDYKIERRGEVIYDWFLTLRVLNIKLSYQTMNPLKSAL